MHVSKDLISLREALIKKQMPPQGLGEKLGQWEEREFDIYANPIEYATMVFPKKFRKRDFTGVICIFYSNINPSSESTPRTVTGYYLRWLMREGMLKREKKDEYTWL